MACAPGAIRTCVGDGRKIHGKPKKIEEKTEAAKKQEDATAKYQGTKKGEQQDKTKCWHCKKKVGLLGTECKCNYVFCNVHRMPEDHACTYNYEEEGKDLLKKQVKKLEHHKVGRLDSV